MRNHLLRFRDPEAVVDFSARGERRFAVRFATEPVTLTGRPTCFQAG